MLKDTSKEAEKRQDSRALENASFEFLKPFVG